MLGYRNLLLWNGAICAALIALTGLFRPDWPITVIYVSLLVGGLFRSLQYTGFGTLVYADIPPEKTGASIGFHSMVQQFSVTLGVAISAGILSLIIALRGHETPSLADFTITFFVVAAISATAIPICLTLREDAGAELSGHRPPLRNKKPNGAGSAPSG
jgi:MFS family permease